MKKNPTPEYPEIRPGQSIELLKALHILTRDGKMNQDSRRKLKQVYHLYQFIEPLLQEVKDERGAVTLVDHGAGKSYLGFILYDLFFKSKEHQQESSRAVEVQGARSAANETYLEGRRGSEHRATQQFDRAVDSAHIYGIETREELVTHSRDLAQHLGFGGMSFLNLSVADSITSDQLPAQVDVVTALHACNTATDDAIKFALAKQAKHIVLVPCCQAEVAAVLRKNKGAALKNTLTELWRHPIHTREFGSHATNVLRCLQLEAHGYQVTVTELVGWEHSMKNELIIASYKDLPRQKAAQRLQEMLELLGLEELSARFFTE
ncbi:MAG: SAM-dependent methyltransferase [Sideroxydans sp.]|nr:SAM-dependent methyltransferase [Sideroxydans sp.]